MKLGFRKSEKGFTLIELIIVLSVLAVLAAVIVPNVSGFLGRSKERAWAVDRDILQAAVDSWRTDIGKRSGNPWPITGTAIGAPTFTGAAGTTVDAKNGIIDVTKFYDATHPDQNYLKGTDTVKSASKTNNKSTQDIDGSYIWYIDTSGVVHSIYLDTSTTPATVKTDFQTDIYP